MPTRKLNCWEDRQCGREPGGARVGELGPCPAATEAACDGLNEGQCAGRLCWAVAGTFCDGAVQGTHAQKTPSCERCLFFRRVKYEEGSGFQLLRPGMGTDDPAELHRQLNHAVELLSICRDIFACLAVRPLLGRLVAHALAITRAASASVYLPAPDVVRPSVGQAPACPIREWGKMPAPPGAERELALAAHAGFIGRPARIRLSERPDGGRRLTGSRIENGKLAIENFQFPGADEACPVTEAVRAGCLHEALLTVPEHPEPVHVAAIPIGGDAGLGGVLEVVKPEGFSTDDEWFLRELGIIAGLGLSNARQVEELRQLKRFDKAKSRFVAILMHHIGSPLATVACSLHALAKLGESLRPDDRKKLIDGSLDRLGAVQALSRRLLDLAALRNGTALAATQPVDPADLLRQEVETRVPTALQRGVELLLSLPEGATEQGDFRLPIADFRLPIENPKSRIENPKILADPDGLRVLFGNLLDNAIKYTAVRVSRDPSDRPDQSDQSHLRVEAALSVERGRVRVAIRDQGIGIPSEEQGRIFEEFHRASNAASSKAAGFGLGLAMVKELVDRYGGTLELESALGVGTTFSIEFPSVEQDAAGTQENAGGMGPAAN